MRRLGSRVSEVPGLMVRLADENRKFLSENESYRHLDRGLTSLSVKM